MIFTFFCSGLQVEFEVQACTVPTCYELYDLKCRRQYRKNECNSYGAECQVHTYTDLCILVRFRIL